MMKDKDQLREGRICLITLLGGMYAPVQALGDCCHAWTVDTTRQWIQAKAAGVNLSIADGTFYIYYDEPNDEDPHLKVYDDLKSGKGRNLGEVFADPSHGSDSGIFRDEDGSFHLIYEDWSSINARAHSWDSPLAGHADSPDGIHGFEPHEHPAPIDERTVPLPEFGTYNHGPTGEHTFHKHQGPQNAYGDYTLIKVGAQYYLFCDFDPHGRPMRN